MLAGFRMASKAQESLPLYFHPTVVPEDCRYHPYIYYRFLKKHFGKTRSPTWDQRKKIERRKKPDPYHWITQAFQWHYLIRTPNGFIMFNDQNRQRLNITACTVSRDKKLPRVFDTDRNIEYHYENPRKPAPKALQRDVENFFAEFRKYAISLLKDGQYMPPPTAHNGRITLNPFEIHYSNFRYHLRLIKKLQKRIWKKNLPHESVLNAELEHLASSAFIMLMASFDGFVNLLYECYLQEQIRMNQKIKERIERESITSKIQMLPVYCTGFTAAHSWEETFKKEYTKAMKAFSELMTMRNKLVHANLFDFDYTNLIEEDTFLFYMWEDKDTETFVFGRHSIIIGLRIALDILTDAEKTILNLISVILRTMRPKQRAEFRKAYRQYWVGYSLTPKGTRFVNEAIY